MYHIITLRIQALSLVESHDLLENRRTELRRTKPYPTAFPYLYRSCTRDICKISTFSNFEMFGWIKSKPFTCLIRGISFYYIKQIDRICRCSFSYRYTVWHGKKSDPLASAARKPFFCSSHIMTSYCVSTTEQATAKSYLFLKNCTAPLANQY